METFLILGMCFLCYEICEFLVQCSPQKDEREKSQQQNQQDQQEQPERRQVIYSISERNNPVQENSPWT